jgi:Domain of unknown function (DUF3846)
VNALVITTEGKTSVRDFSDDNLLAEFQEEVGGYVEVVNTTEFSIWFNEDGVRRNLPINEIASWLLSPWTGGGLVGNVIVTGPERAGEPTDVTDKIASTAEQLARIARGTPQEGRT